MEDWLDNTDVATDSLFLDLAPRIAAEAQLNVKPTDDEFAEVATSDQRIQNVFADVRQGVGVTV